MYLFLYILYNILRLCYIVGWIHSQCNITHNVSQVLTDRENCISCFAPWAWNNFNKDPELYTFIFIDEFKIIVVNVLLMEACGCFS